MLIYKIIFNCKQNVQKIKHLWIFNKKSVVICRKYGRIVKNNLLALANKLANNVANKVANTLADGVDDDIQISCI